MELSNVCEVCGRNITEGEPVIEIPAEKVESAIKLSAILRGYNGEKVLALLADDQLDFLPNIKAGNKDENKILKTWEQYFRSIGTPYLITQTGKTLTLWKEKRAEHVLGKKGDVKVKSKKGRGVDWGGYRPIGTTNPLRQRRT